CFRQKHAAVVHEAGPRVKTPCRMTFGTSLNEQRADPEFDACLSNSRQQSGSQALSPGSWANKKVINEGAQPAELHAEGKGEYHVADRPFRRFDEPNLAQSEVIEECGESAGRHLAGKRIAGLPVELGHQFNEDRDILMAGRPNLRHHRSSLLKV